MFNVLMLIMGFILLVRQDVNANYECKYKIPSHEWNIHSILNVKIIEFSVYYIIFSFKNVSFKSWGFKTIYRDVTIVCFKFDIFKMWKYNLMKILLLYFVDKTFNLTTDTVIENDILQVIVLNITKVETLWRGIMEQIVRHSPSTHVQFSICQMRLLNVSVVFVFNLYLFNVRAVHL